MYLKKSVIVVVAVFLLCSCNRFENAPYPDVVVTKLQTFPGSKRATASSFVLNNKAYVLFGRPELFETPALSDCWEYTPETDSWIQKADFPAAGRVGAIAETVNGKAYVGFGFRTGGGVYGSDSTIFSDFWMYNPHTDSWTRKADFPKTAYTGKAPLNSCSSFSYQKWIYITGLYNGKSYPKEVWRYDTEADKWERMNDFPGSPRSAAVCCTDGIFYYFGLGYNQTFRSDWWQYSPATDTWKEMKKMPGKGRVNATAFTVDNRFFVASGHYISGTLTGNEYFSDILEYERSADKWYRIGNIPTGGRSNMLSFTINHKAYLAFGESKTQVFNDIWTFAP